MKVPLSWLREFVEVPFSGEELARILTMAGLEVGYVTYVGVEGAELPWEREKILVANVLEVKPHPNADLLVLAEVDYGSGVPHTVVTGAPNLFPYKGQGRLTSPLKVVFAKEGSKLYDGHKEGKVLVTLKGRPVRGVMSDAMLCSEKELGLSDEHEGILILEDDAPVGKPLCEVIGEVILDIDLTPNLARCLSIVGIARELAALTKQHLHLPNPKVEMEGLPIAERVKVTIEDPTLCQRFTVGLIEGVTIKPSPHWMQRRLRYAGMRPVNNIVDISNYVMLEWGQPTHAFDADKVADQHLRTRLAQPGEKLTTLDGKERELTHPSIPNPPLLVVDPVESLALAGVMGGEKSEVRETTTRVLLEAAIWEPKQIRRTAQAFKLPSEASRRFERGVDIEIPLIAQHRALELMRTLAGGKVAQGFVDVYPQPWQPLTFKLPPSEIKRIVGIQLSAVKIAGLLNALGFDCTVQNDKGMGDMTGYSVRMGLDLAMVYVKVPSFRQDVTTLADLCEEVARLYGYEHIPTTMLAEELPSVDAYPTLELEQKVRDILVGCGLYEAITYSVTSMATVGLISPQALNLTYLKLSNPLSPEREYLRQSLLPTLLEALAFNLREQERVSLFEVGKVFLPRATSEAEDAEWFLPTEIRRLGIVMAGQRSSLNWQTKAPTQELDFFDLKGVIEALLTRLGFREGISYLTLEDDERFHPGRAARLELQVGGKKILLGVMGELHPDLCERLELQVPRALAAELELDTLLTLAQPLSYRTISRYPATVQDLAIVAGKDVPAVKVAQVIRKGAGPMLDSLTLFDLYSGPQVGEGKRSLAYRLTFRLPDRTLTDSDLVKVRGKIIKLLEREIGATMRS